MRKFYDLVQTHDLEKYYANNALVNKVLPQIKKEEKKKKVCKTVIAAGVLAAIVALVIYVVKSREDDYYDDDFFFDDDDCDYDEYEFEEEFEEDLA